MSALFELASEFRALADKLNEADFDEQTIADTLDGASGEFDEKIINIAKYAKNEKAEAAAISAAIKDMQAREKAHLNKAASLEKYILDGLDRAGRPKVTCPFFVVSIKQNPEAVTVEDETAIPRDYFKEIPATFQLDKTLVKQAIKDGFNVPGCHLSRGTRLEVK